MASSLFRDQPSKKQAIEWVVLTKEPVPGKVKTRLISQLGGQGACDLYVQLLTRLEITLKKTLQTTPSQVALWIAGDASHKAFKPWRSFSTFYQQPDHGDLGVRMAMAVRSSLSRGRIPILIGVDVPDLDDVYLCQCVKMFESHDLVISPAEDGGYGLLGMKQLYAELFEGKAWGTDSVFDETRKDIDALKIDTGYLPTVWDVDEIADVERFRLVR